MPPTNKLDKDVIADRFKGCLLGMAIGDAAGLPAEGLSPYQVACKFHFIDGFFPVGNDIGNYSGETRGAAMIARTIVEHGGSIDPAAISAAVIALDEKDPQSSSGRGRRYFSRTIPIAMAAAATSMHDQDLLNACRLVCGEKVAKSDALAYFIFAKALAECIRNADALSNPFELYESDRSLLFRLTNVASKAEAKLEETGPLNRLCDCLSFTQKKLMDKTWDPYKFIGCVSQSANPHEALVVALYCFLQATDEYMTVFKTVSLGGPSTLYGAMVGALVGAYIGASAKTFPSDMKDSVQNGAKLESLAAAMADCYGPKEQ